MLLTLSVLGSLCETALPIRTLGAVYSGIYCHLLFGLPAVLAEAIPLHQGSVKLDFAFFYPWQKYRKGKQCRDSWTILLEKIRWFKGHAYCFSLLLLLGGRSCVPGKLSISFQVYHISNKNMTHPYKPYATWCMLGRCWSLSCYSWIKLTTYPGCLSTP